MKTKLELSGMRDVLGVQFAINWPTDDSKANGRGRFWLTRSFHFDWQWELFGQY